MGFPIGPTGASAPTTGHRRRSASSRGGERSERCLWQIQRGERVAAVKISSVRRKAARKFWAPQQGHAALRMGYRRSFRRGRCLHRPKSLAEFAARTPRRNQIIFPAACTSEKFFSAASVSEGRAQSAAIPIGNEIEDFMPVVFTWPKIFRSPPRRPAGRRAGSRWRIPPPPSSRSSRTSRNGGAGAPS